MLSFIVMQTSEIYTTLNFCISLVHQQSRQQDRTRSSFLLLSSMALQMVCLPRDQLVCCVCCVKFILILLNKINYGKILIPFYCFPEILTWWPTLTVWCLFRHEIWATFPRQDEAMKYVKKHTNARIFSYQDHANGQRRFLAATYEEFWKRCTFFSSPTWNIQSNYSYWQQR